MPSCCRRSPPPGTQEAGLEVDNHERSRLFLAELACLVNLPPCEEADHQPLHCLAELLLTARVERLDGRLAVDPPVLVRDGIEPDQPEQPVGTHTGEHVADLLGPARWSPGPRARNQAGPRAYSQTSSSSQEPADGRQERADRIDPVTRVLTARQRQGAR